MALSKLCDCSVVGIFTIVPRGHYCNTFTVIQYNTVIHLLFFKIALMQEVSTVTLFSFGNPQLILSES